jgi:hypothetical protein
MAFLQDFWRRLAQGLPAKVRADVIAALDSDRMIDVLRTELERRIALEPGLRPTLALWSRRLVGDTMLMAQSALRESPNPTPKDDGLGPVFTELIASHSLRMDALGLTA